MWQSGPPLDLAIGETSSVRGIAFWFGLQHRYGSFLGRHVGLRSDHSQLDCGEDAD